MAVFTNLLVLADPSGGSKASLGDDQIRNDKEAILARLALEHQNLISGTNDDTSATAMGRHKPPVTCILVDTFANINDGSAANTPIAGRAAYDTTNNRFLVADVSSWTTHVLGVQQAADVYGFYAKKTVDQTIGHDSFTVVTNWTEDFDAGSRFNASNGLFTAPVNGVYAFHCGAVLSTMGTENVYFEIEFRAAGATYARARFYNAKFNNNGYTQSSATIKLDKDDTVAVRVHHNTGVTETLIGSGNHSYFCGHLVGLL